MSASSPSEPASQHGRQAAASAVRRAANEVRRRVIEWRESPLWQDNDTNRDRHELTIRAVTKVDALPETPEPRQLAETVRPIVEAGRPTRAGPEQAIYAAVDRLREALQQLPQ